MPIERYRGRWLDDLRNFRLEFGEGPSRVVLSVCAAPWIFDEDGPEVYLMTIELFRQYAPGLRGRATASYDRSTGGLDDLRDHCGHLAGVDEAALRDRFRELRDALVHRCERWEMDQGHPQQMPYDWDAHEAGAPVSFARLFPAARDVSVTVIDDEAISGVWWALDSYRIDLEGASREIVCEIVHGGESCGTVVLAVDPEHDGVRRCNPGLWTIDELASMMPGHGESQFGLRIVSVDGEVPDQVARALDRGWPGRMIAERFHELRRIVRSHVTGVDERDQLDLSPFVRAALAAPPDRPIWDLVCAVLPAAIHALEAELASVDPHAPGTAFGRRVLQRYREGSWADGESFMDSLEAMRSSN